MAIMISNLKLRRACAIQSIARKEIIQEKNKDQHSQQPILVSWIVFVPPSQGMSTSTCNFCLMCSMLRITCCTRGLSKAYLLLYQRTIKGILSHLCRMNRIATRILNFTPSDCSRMAVSFNNSSPANMSGGRSSTFTATRHTTTISSLSCGTLSFHVSCNMFALE